MDGMDNQDTTWQWELVEVTFFFRSQLEQEITAQQSNMDLG